jgi:hypothetical protein
MRLWARRLIATWQVFIKVLYKLFGTAYNYSYTQLKKYNIFHTGFIEPSR